MGRELDDIIILFGLGIVGFMAYKEWYKGKGFEDIIGDIDTKLRAFLDDVTSKLPPLPSVPTTGFQTPAQVPAAAAPIPETPITPITPTQAPAEPEPSNNNNNKSTNTIKAEDKPKEKSPQAVPPALSGQLPTNPQIPPPPAGSGGALIAFAGDFSSNAKAVATVASIAKTGCQLIVGTGDYSYDNESAIDWFTKIIGKQWTGKMKGCLGNHDVHDTNGFLRIFGMTNFNSTVKVAPNLAVVFINTESGIDEATLTSLTKAATGQAKHVVYVQHKPFHTSKDAHHPGSENKWGTIIDRVAKANGVKMVLSGHNHNYEHYYDGGVHYITTGAAGRSFYHTNCDGAGPVKCVNDVNGFLKVSVAENLICQFISNSGEILDSFSVTPIGVQYNLIYPSSSYYVYVTPKSYTGSSRRR